VEFITTLMAGGAELAGSGPHGQQIYTVGGGGVWLPEWGPLEFGGEAYLQFGDAGKVAGETLDAVGWAIRARAKWHLAEKVWFEAGYVFLSGDDNGLDDEEGRFFSYENNDEFLIIESNEFGLDIDNNLQSWRTALGFPMVDAEGDDFPPLMAVLRVGGFRFVEKVPLSPDPFAGTVRRSDNLGFEVDLTLRLPISRQIWLDATGAVLFGADALESFTLHGEDHAEAMTFGVHLQF
jgi:hypothetical protein